MENRGVIITNDTDFVIWTCIFNIHKIRSVLIKLIARLHEYVLLHLTPYVLMCNNELSEY